VAARVSPRHRPAVIIGGGGATRVSVWVVSEEVARTGDRGGPG
jgi:hypothetical protein